MGFSEVKKIGRPGIGKKNVESLGWQPIRFRKSMSVDPETVNTMWVFNPSLGINIWGIDNSKDFRLYFTKYYLEIVAPGENYWIKIFRTFTQRGTNYNQPTLYSSGNSPVSDDEAPKDMIFQSGTSRITRLGFYTQDTAVNATSFTLEIKGYLMNKNGL